MKNSIWNRNYSLVFLVNLFNAFSFHILTPTIPKYVVSIGNGAAIAGFVATAFTVTAILTRPIAGYYINLKKKTVILMAALGIIALSILGYAFSSQLGLIVLFRLLHGIGWGMVTTASSTVAVASLPLEKMGRGIGLFGIASSIASVFAPNMGLFLADTVGFFPMFMIAFVLAATGCVCSAFINEAQLRQPQRANGEEGILKNLFSKQALVPAAVILCVGIGMASISNFIALYADELSVKNIGYYFTVAGAVMLFMRPMFGRLSDVVNYVKIVAVALLGYATVFLVLGLSKALAGFLFAAVLYGTFYGALCPIIQTWCVKVTDSGKSGTANSTYYTALDIGSGIGASLAGVVSSMVGYSKMYFLAILPQLIALGIVLFYAVSAKKKNRDR